MVLSKDTVIKNFVALVNKVSKETGIEVPKDFCVDVLQGDDGVAVAMFREDLRYHRREFTFEVNSSVHEVIDAELGEFTFSKINKFIHNRYVVCNLETGSVSEYVPEWLNKNSKII